MKSKNYIGFEKFLSKETPTPSTCGGSPTLETGGKYVYVIGPFRTAKAARWAVKYGNNNPHFSHVNDAERIAKKWDETKP